MSSNAVGGGFLQGLKSWSYILKVTHILLYLQNAKKRMYVGAQMYY